MIAVGSKLKLKGGCVYEVLGFGIEISEVTGIYWCFVRLMSDNYVRSKVSGGMILEFLNSGLLTVEK